MRGYKALFIATVVLFTVLFTACASQGEERYTWSELKPQPIPEDARCPECGMYVRDYKNWASEALLEGGEVVYFDDPGDMVIYHNKNEEKIKKIYVKDYYTQEWIDAREAVYVVDARISTPMGFGIVPFKDRESARAFKEDYATGGVLTFKELVERGAKVE